MRRRPRDPRWNVALGWCMALAWGSIALAHETLGKH